MLMPVLVPMLVSRPQWSAHVTPCQPLPHSPSTHFDRVHVNPTSLAVIGGEWALDASQLAYPPVVSTLCLLDDADSIALPKCQIAIALPRKVVQRRHKLGLLAGDPRRRWRWGFLFRGGGGLAVAGEVVGMRDGGGEGDTARGLVGRGGGDEAGFGGGGV